MATSLILSSSKYFPVLFCILLAIPFMAIAQKPEPPVPVEFFFGNEKLNFQLVLKKKLDGKGRFNFFTVASYTSSYEHPEEDFRIVMPVQLSYELGKGFGIMAGTDINSYTGLSPVVGPQFNYASPTFLAVTVASVFLNEDRDFKIFGLYEYKPPINDNWSIYTRLQFIYNHSWELGSHNRSYLYLRGGLKKGPLIFGAGANLDQFGPDKYFEENYGVFIRWEFK